MNFCLLTLLNCGKAHPQGVLYEPKLTLPLFHLVPASFGCNFLMHPLKLLKIYCLFRSFLLSTTKAFGWEAFCPSILQTHLSASGSNYHNTLFLPRKCYATDR